jgi:hypothetical protein
LLSGGCVVLSMRLFCRLRNLWRHYNPPESMTACSCRRIEPYREHSFFCQHGEEIQLRSHFEVYVQSLTFKKKKKTRLPHIHLSASAEFSRHLFLIRANHFSLISGQLIVQNILDIWAMLERTLSCFWDGIPAHLSEFRLPRI